MKNTARRRNRCATAVANTLPPIAAAPATPFIRPIAVGPLPDSLAQTGTSTVRISPVSAGPLLRQPIRMR